ncbi:MAG: LytTR family transcriptional regulator DNA-binding domain-containing protein [Aureispira sp.]
MQEEQETFYFSQSAIQIAFTDILCLESSNNYVLIHVLTRPTPLLERVKMIKLIEGFPSHLFIKTHRSYYVNKKHIVARPSKYKFELSNGIQLSASRSCVENLTGVLGF